VRAVGRRGPPDGRQPTGSRTAATMSSTPGSSSSFSAGEYGTGVSGTASRAAASSAPGRFSVARAIGSPDSPNERSSSSTTRSRLVRSIEPHWHGHEPVVSRGR